MGSRLMLVLLCMSSAAALLPDASRGPSVMLLRRSPHLSRRPPPSLRADAGAVIRPAPRSSWRAVVGSGGWRVGAVTALICLDILCYSFPMPFMPEFLASRGHTARETSVLLSSFSFAAFASGGTIVVAQSMLPAKGGDALRRRCWLLAVAAAAMAAVSGVQALLPSYRAMVVARSLQGAISQLSWSVGLALAASLPPCAGVAATAWAMTGNSMGEVAISPISPDLALPRPVVSADLGRSRLISTRGSRPSARRRWRARSTVRRSTPSEACACPTRVRRSCAR